jgi:hypothetical protein
MATANTTKPLSSLDVTTDPEKGLSTSTATPEPETLTHISPDALTSITTALGGPPPTKLSITQHFWPPSGLPEGLYKTVLRERYNNQNKFYAIATIYNACLIAQLVLGAALTSLSASNAADHHTAITILAAANTVNAGLVALLHNSGLPGRIRNDFVEYEKVQLWMEEVMRGGVALGNGLNKEGLPDGLTVRDRVVGEANARYWRARATVEKNRPNAYIGTNGQTPLNGANGPGAQPGVTPNLGAAGPTL